MTFIKKKQQIVKIAKNIDAIIIILDLVLSHNSLKRYYEEGTTEAISLFETDGFPACRNRSEGKILFAVTF
jgi:hypothetical protein